MKKAALIITISILAIGCKQKPNKISEKDVPPVVLNTFKTENTTSCDSVIWKLKKEEKIYDATCFHKKSETKVKIKESGELLEKSTDLQAAEFPRPILEHINSNKE